MTTGNLLKTVAFPTCLKLSELANFNAIAIKFKPPNQIAKATLQLISTNEKERAVIYLISFLISTPSVFMPPTFPLELLVCLSQEM